MSKNLVIVESPAKAKTIQGYLGKDFRVESSFGHVADLPKKGMGIDLESFQPQYKVSPDKEDVVKKLKSASKKAEMIWLASDEDREGEAIAWHLANQLEIPKEKMRRIVFNEITKSAIQSAIKKPRDIDQSLVNAQQARRVLDRIVGFEVSPVLWRKVKTGLSAGRVQSVAVRLVVEREKDIQAFEAENYYRVVGAFISEDGKSVQGVLANRLKSTEEAQGVLQDFQKALFLVDKVNVRPSKKKAAAPFTTSTMQQEASRKLGYSVGQTMRLAQRLYEAGHITYMRTDSVNLSSQAIDSAKEFISQSFGKEYSSPRNYSTKNKSAQEAHEAIRPTKMNVDYAGADSGQTRLYHLIWQRTLASQMADADVEKTTIKIKNDTNEYIFEAKGEVLLFDGFLKLYLESKEDEEENEDTAGLLPKLNVGDRLDNKQILATEKFTKHPPRFSEASLVQKLEELGIGRPSTYAPTISTIMKREYVEKPVRDGREREYLQLLLDDKGIQTLKKTETTGAEKGKLSPTDIGFVVNEFLVENFPRVLDYGFTAQVEGNFDAIANGKQEWVGMIKSFYSDFHPRVEDIKENAERASGERVLGQDPKTKKNIIARIGRYGPIVQIGNSEDEEKPSFASIPAESSITTITLEEALELFSFPKTLGEMDGEGLSVNLGRFGPYIKMGSLSASIPKGEDPGAVDLERAKEIVRQKQAENAPIHFYEQKEVTKGRGRFGPFIKWDGMFINVSKKYDFDDLSVSDIETLIEEKKQKEIDKIIHSWEEEGIRVEKARWGRSNIVYGKMKINLGKEIDAQALGLKEVKEIISQNTKKPAKKTTKKKSTGKKK